jgi:non-specific serine/threonine protein kinase
MLAPDHVQLLARELDNLRAALRTAIDATDLETGLRLGVALWPLWYVRGLYGEGRAWLAELLQGTEAPAENDLRTRALAWAGHLAFCQGDYVAAEAQLEESLRAARAGGDDQSVAVALQLLGTPARGRGDLAHAEELYEQARSIDHRLGSRVWEAMTVANLAMTAEDGGDHVSAERHAAEALALYRAQNHAWGVARMREVLARVAVSRADYATARAQLEEAVTFQRELGDRQGLLLSLPTLAQLALGEGDTQRAAQLLEEGLALAREAGDKLSLARGLEAVAYMLAQDRPETAVRVAGAAAALRDTLGAHLTPSDRDRLGQWEGSALRLLGPAAYSTRLAEGRRLPLEHAIADAVAGAKAVAAKAPSRAAVAEPLTAREQQVALLLARGLSNHQIAEALVIADGTARIHAEHVLAKLGLRSRVQVAAWARSNGLLPDSEG